MKIKIDKDVFNIADRIKEIDSGYYVLFNTNSKKFEIHNLNTKNSYCLTIPFRQLDARTLELLNKTHIKNYKKIISDIEKDNYNAEKTNVNRMKEISDYKIKELLKYSKIGIEDIGTDVFKTTWI